MWYQFEALIILLLAAVIGGCAAYRPDPLNPQAELESLRGRSVNHFVVERSQPGQASSAPTPLFNPADGLDESEVVAVALTLNPQIRARRAEIGEAKATLIIAGLWPNPEIGFSPRVGIDGESGYVVEADALFDLLRTGQRSAQKKIAHARVEESEAGVIADEFRLVAEVRAQRLAVLAADRQVALLNEVLDLRQRALDLVRRRRQIGEGTELDVSATELEVAQVQRDLRRARIELAAEIRELNRHLGLPSEYDLKLTGLGEPLAVTVFDDVSDEELDRRVLIWRLELRAKEAEYRRVEQELRLAVLRQYPSLKLGPAFERELAGDKSLGLGVSLELPLLNQNQGEIAEKRAARDRTRAEYIALLHRLRADAVAARAAVRAAKAEVEMQEKEVLPLLRRNQELFEGAFRARELNIIDWMTAQQRAVNARREYLDALVRYRKAIIQMESAAGRALSQPTTLPATQPTSMKERPL